MYSKKKEEERKEKTEYTKVVGSPMVNTATENWTRHLLKDLYEAVEPVNLLSILY